MLWDAWIADEVVTDRQNKREEGEGRGREEREERE